MVKRSTASDHFAEPDFGDRKRPPFPIVSASEFICMFRPTFSHTLLAEVDRGDADAECELGRLYLEGRADTSSNTASKDGKYGIASFTPGVPWDHAAVA